MPSRRFRIGTRSSKLALAQTDAVVRLLKKQVASANLEVVTIKTWGDQDTRTPLEKMGGGGAFVKALETALLEKRVDLAIHSAKDLPAVMTAGLTLAAVPERGACEDALVSNNGRRLQDLRSGAVIGTGSPRRRAQLLHLRPDLEVADIRGNLLTRLDKLATGRYDSLLLARAGLQRLGLADRITEVLSSEMFLPAPGQGFLAVQTRVNDEECVSLCTAVDDAAAHSCLKTERELLAKLDAGCSAAVGGWARFAGGRLRLSAVVLEAQGKKRAFAESEADDERIPFLVDQVTNKLISQGALRFIRQ